MSALDLGPVRAGLVAADAAGPIGLPARAAGYLRYSPEIESVLGPLPPLAAAGVARQDIYGAWWLGRIVVTEVP